MGQPKFEHKTVKTVRGTDSVVIARMTSKGWEHVGSDHGRVSTSLQFRRPKPPVPWKPIAALFAIAVVGLGIGGIAEALGGDEESAAGDAKTTVSASPSVDSSSSADPSESNEPSSAATSEKRPDGPTVKIVCYSPDFETHVDFVISRLKPDFTEAWAADIPTDPKTGEQHCDDGDANEDGDKPRITPVNAVEQAIWDADEKSGDGHERWTLTIPYFECVQHDSPDYRNVYPDGPNLVDEAKTMLSLCPDHPNAAAIRSRIPAQERFENQIGTETLDDGEWAIGSERKAGTYRTTSAGGTLACYWSRWSGGRVIQSDAFGPLEQARTVKVSLKAGEKFKTENCGVWFRLTP